MKKNIIIVEYSKSVDKLISFVLEERGYQVLHASSFEELLNIENEILETSIGFCEAIMAYEEENKSLDYLLDKGVPTIALIDDMDYENFKFKDGVVDLIIKGDIYSIVEKITNSIIRLEHNSQIKILLVDDSESFRSLVKANLENSLFQVLEANDGDVGLEVIKENEDIHLVITDFYMPNMIGTDLIKNIREFATKENLPIIGISSDDKTTSQFLQAGANDYINKNFTNEEFLSRVYNGLELVEKFHEIEKGKILLEQYKKSVDESNIVSKTDLKGKITYVNDRFCQISGYTREELIGQSHNIVRHPDISNAVYKELWEAIKDKRTWRGIIKNRAKDGGTYYVDSFIMPILDNKGNVKEYMSVRHDISKVVEQEQQIRKNFSDPMTGMANRQKLFKDLEDFENNKSFLLSFIDIDDFSNINDFFGHAIGDNVIVSSAKKVYKEFGEKYKLYRVGVDVFAVASFEDIGVIEFAEDIEQGINSIEKEPIIFNDKEVYFTISAGVAQSDKENIIIFADIALKESKTKKRHVSIFEDEFYDSSKFENNLLYLKKLKIAIKNDKIVPFFQPLYNLHKSKIEKFECLIRMIDEDGKVISPFFFLDIAKKAKLYTQLTKIMIEKSFKNFQNSHYEFSINLTIDDIFNKELVSYLEEKIDEYQVAKRLVLEVVESEEIENFEAINSFFEVMKAKGCKIAIDDFGTGYSNFEYLAKLDVDYIKLDGSLVKNIKTDKSARLVAKTIHDFCKNINARTIAEYVEDKDILNVLMKMGVHYAQGYYIGKPEPTTP